MSHALFKIIDLKVSGTLLCRNRSKQLKNIFQGRKMKQKSCLRIFYRKQKTTIFECFSCYQKRKEILLDLWTKRFVHFHSYFFANTSTA